jgi:hypothetical protein
MPFRAVPMAIRIVEPAATRLTPETFTVKAGDALKIDEMQVKADTRKFKDFIDPALRKQLPGVEKSRTAARPGS